MEKKICATYATDKGLIYRINTIYFMKDKIHEQILNQEFI